MTQRPDIFVYADYRVFLRDYYTHAKATNTSFSYRYFANKAGFAAPNFLYLIIEGKRNLTKNFIPLFAKTIGFNKKERQFFEALVSFNQAKDVEAKRYYLEVLHGLKKNKVGALLNNEQFACISTWYYAVIIEMVAFPHFAEDHAWIKKELGEKVSIREIKEALANLEKFGFLKRNDEGNLVQANLHLYTEDDVSHTAAYAFHEQMLTLSREVLTTINGAHREISGVTLAASEQQFREIRTMVREFEDNVLRYLAENPDLPDKVFQLNFQLFPLTGGIKRG